MTLPEGITPYEIMQAFWVDGKPMLELLQRLSVPQFEYCLRDWGNVEPRKELEAEKAEKPVEKPAEKAETVAETVAEETSGPKAARRALSKLVLIQTQTPAPEHVLAAATGASTFSIQRILEQLVNDHMVFERGGIYGITDYGRLYLTELGDRAFLHKKPRAKLYRAFLAELALKEKTTLLQQGGSDKP